MAAPVLPAHALEELENACQELLLDPDRHEKGTASPAALASAILEHLRLMIVQELGDELVPDSLRPALAKATSKQLARKLRDLPSSASETAAQTASTIAGVRFAPPIAIALPATAKAHFEQALTRVLERPPTLLAPLTHEITEALREAAIAHAPEAVARALADSLHACRARLADVVATFMYYAGGAGGDRATAHVERMPARASTLLGEVARLLGMTWDGEIDRASIDPNAAVPYVPARRYVLADTIVHTMYGVGVVREVVPGKITVQFEGGPRVLVHGRGS